MQRFTHFSRHAFARLLQRTRLSCEEAAWILDTKLFVHIGHELGFKREHLLFYSVHDKDFFVAIRDSLTGSVITVLSIEYHDNRAWKVKADNCKKAQELAQAAAPYRPECTTLTPAALFVISALYLDDQGQQKAKVLLKTPSAPYQNEIRTLLNDDGLFDRLPNLADLRSIAFSHVFALLVRLGNHGNPVVLAIQDAKP